MSVKCLSPVRLYGELAGEYERGQTYPDARLAAEHPDHFAVLPDPGSPAADTAGPVPDAGTVDPEADIPSKRKNRRHNP